jgi:hypothetical protein
MERTCVNYFRFFVNFINSCAWYVHVESMCTGYDPHKKYMSILIFNKTNDLQNYKVMIQFSLLIKRIIKIYDNFNFNKINNQI